MRLRQTLSHKRIYIVELSRPDLAVIENIQTIFERRLLKCKLDTNLKYKVSVFVIINQQSWSHILFNIKYLLFPQSLLLVLQKGLSISLEYKSCSSRVNNQSKTKICILTSSLSLLALLLYAVTALPLHHSTQTQQSEQNKIQTSAVLV